MAHTLYQNATHDLSWQVFFIDRNKIETTPAISSGTFSLYNNAGNIVVPASTATISDSNKLTFRLRPTSGSATVGVFKEVWEAFIAGQSYQHVENLTVKERY